jgi:hypothetical protein
MRDHAFAVEGPFADAGVWWFEVHGGHVRRHGPFATAQAASTDAEGLFRRWVARARGLGGWAWRRAARQWVVTLPDGVPCDGVPLRAPPTSRVPWTPANRPLTA